MDKKILGLLILIILIFLLLVGLFGWQTGFTVKENREESKSGLKLINQNTEGFQDVSFQDVSSEQDNAPVFTGDVIRISSSRSSGGGGSGGGSGGGGSGGNNGGTDNPPDTTQKPIVEVFINPSTLTKNKNDEFTINVKISSQEKIYAAEFELSFSSNVLEVVNIKEGSFLSKDGKSTSMQLCEKGVISEVCPVIDDVNGKIKFSNTRLGQVGGISGQGNLAEITFKAVDIGTTNLILSNVKIADMSLDIDKFQIDIKNSQVIIT